MTSPSQILRRDVVLNKWNIANLVRGVTPENARAVRSLSVHIISEDAGTIIVNFAEIGNTEGLNFLSNLHDLAVLIKSIM